MTFGVVQATGVVAYPGGAGGGGAAISAAGGSASSGTVVFSNANGVSFGYNNGTITATVTPGAAAGIAAVQAGTQTQTSGTMVFANSNGITFGMSGSSQVTGSVATTYRASNDAIGLNSAVSNVTATINSSGLSFDARGYAGTATAVTGLASVTLNSGGFSFNGSNLVGTGSSVTGAASVTLNSNGLQFNGSGLAGTNTAITGAAAMTLNSSGLSFNGLNLAGTSTGFAGNNISGSITHNSAGINLSLSVAGAGAAGSLSVYGQSNTTNASSGTMPASSLNVAGYGIISVGISNGSIQISGPDTTSYAPLSVGFSTNGNTAGNTGFGTDRVVFVGANNITLSGSTNAGSQTISIIGGAGGGGGGAALSAGTQSVSSGTVVFSNSNGVTFGMSGSSQITASVAPQVMSMFALGNTTQNSSSAIDARSVSFNGLGAMTVGYSANSIQLSAPATSSLSATGIVSVSVNGSTISIGVGPQLSFINALTGDVTTLTQVGQGSVQVYPLNFGPFPFSASRADLMVYNSVSSSSNSSHAGVVSAYVGLYTRNVSTLSLASSGSQSYQWTNTSNNSFGSVSGMRRLSVPIGVNYLGGDLWVAVMSLTSSTNANWFTLSNMGVQPMQTGQLVGLLGEASNNTKQIQPGQGLFSTTSNAMPASMAFSAITGAGQSSTGANVYLQPIQFANFTA